MREIDTCAAEVPIGSAGFLLACGLPAVAVHDYGCIHEHVKRRATCAGHAPQPGKVGCLECLELGHDCPVTAAEVSGDA